MRRQTWLQRSQAVQVVNAYAEAMSAGKSGADRHESTHRNSSAPSQGSKVSGGDLLSMMGKRTVKDG